MELSTTKSPRSILSSIAAKMATGPSQSPMTVGAGQIRGRVEPEDSTMGNAIQTKKSRFSGLKPISRAFSGLGSLAMNSLALYVVTQCGGNVSEVMAVMGRDMREQGTDCGLKVKLEQQIVEEISAKWNDKDIENAANFQDRVENGTEIFDGVEPKEKNVMESKKDACGICAMEIENEMIGSVKNQKKEDIKVLHYSKVIQVFAGKDMASTNKTDGQNEEGAESVRHLMIDGECLNPELRVKPQATSSTQFLEERISEPAGEMDSRALDYDNSQQETRRGLGMDSALQCDFPAKEGNDHTVGKTIDPPSSNSIVSKEGSIVMDEALLNGISLKGQGRLIDRTKYDNAPGVRDETGFSAVTGMVLGAHAVDKHRDEVEEHVCVAKVYLPSDENHLEKLESAPFEQEELTILKEMSLITVVTESSGALITDFYRENRTSASNICDWNMDKTDTISIATTEDSQFLIGLSRQDANIDHKYEMRDKLPAVGFTTYLPITISDEEFPNDKAYHRYCTICQDSTCMASEVNIGTCTSGEFSQGMHSVTTRDLKTNAANDSDIAYNIRKSEVPMEDTESLYKAEHRILMGDAILEKVGVCLLAYSSQPPCINFANLMPKMTTITVDHELGTSSCSSSSRDNTGSEEGLLYISERTVLADKDIEVSTRVISDSNCEGTQETLK
ncbi:hypothetical protein HDU93_007000, partial [Gonapodya sp. JEL0774]